MNEVAELVIKAQTGDQCAFEEIHRRFKDMALVYAYSILGDYGLAEDASQQAFLDAYLDLLTIRTPAAFPGWFRTIVQRHAIRIQRGRRTIMTIPLESAPELVDSGRTPVQELAEKEQRELAQRAIESLPEKERGVTRLYVLDELSLREIGHRLNTPTTTVHGRI